MFSLVIAAAIAFVIAYVTYTTFFGPVKGQHVNGVNAMVYVAMKENEEADKKAAHLAGAQRALSKPSTGPIPVVIIPVGA